MIDFVETHVEFILEFLHVLFPLDVSDRGNRYKGRHGFYSAIRKRTSGGDILL
jgi:hypothetical protein